MTTQDLSIAISLPCAVIYHELTGSLFDALRIIPYSYSMKYSTITVAVVVLLTAPKKAFIPYPFSHSYQVIQLAGTAHKKPTSSLQSNRQQKTYLHPSTRSIHPSLPLFHSQAHPGTSDATNDDLPLRRPVQCVPIGINVHPLRPPKTRPSGTSPASSASLETLSDASFQSLDLDPRADVLLLVARAS